MKITNLGVSNTSLPPQQPVEAAPSTNSTTTELAANAKGYTPSAELANLLALSKTAPAIRNDRVQAALQRLQQGDYHTDASADKTAESMLHTLD